MIQFGKWLLATPVRVPLTARLLFSLLFAMLLATQAGTLQASPIVNTSPPVTLPAAGDGGQVALGDALLSLNGGMMQASAIIGDNPTVTPFNGGVSLTGAAFTQDDQYEVVHFSLTQAESVTFQTYGADGGTNGAGAVHPHWRLRAGGGAVQRQQRQVGRLLDYFQRLRTRHRRGV